MPALIIAAFVAVFIIVAVLGHIHAQKRKKELAEWAHSNGFRFREDKDRSFDSFYGHLSCLCRGSNRYAYNIIEGGSNGRQVCAFDYHYETYSTNSKGHRQTHHHRFSAVIVDTALPLKPLHIRPENFLDKVSEFFGMDDIDFELDEFSRKFYVKSPDRKWAYDVIHQSTMELLLRSPRFTLDFCGPHVVAFRGSTFSVGEFASALALVGGMLDGMPEYLLRELKGEG